MKRVTMAMLAAVLTAWAPSLAGPVQEETALRPPFAPPSVEMVSNEAMRPVTTDSKTLLAATQHAQERLKISTAHSTPPKNLPSAAQQVCSPLQASNSVLTSLVSTLPWA